MAGLLEKITKSVIDLEPDRAVELTEKALEEGNSALKIIDDGLVPGIKNMGEKFGENKIFLPELMVAAKAFKKSFEILEPQLKEGDYEPKGRITLGTVEDDIHDIGKNIVLALLQGSGYEATDLGVDVPKDKFIEEVKENKPNFLGLSALLTTTMPKMEEVIGALDEEGIKGDVKVIVGGAPVTREYAEKIGADGYASNAQKAVELLEGSF